MISLPDSLISRIRSALEVAANVAILVVATLLVIKVIPLSRSRLTDSPKQLSAIPVPAEPQPFGPFATEGTPTAPLAMIEYSDFQCPYCAAFARETLPQLRAQYIAPGKLLFAFRYLPLSIHTLASKAARTAECAGRQGKFWPMHDRLFLTMSPFTDSSFDESARALGLDMPTFDRCVAHDAPSAVQHDADSAAQIGITGTPAFLIGRTNANGTVAVVKVLVGRQTLDQLVAAFRRIT